MPQRLGQHFLKNKAVIKKIIAALDLHRGETIIEIGPGKGALTLPLARQCQISNSTCQIIAVEKDKTLAALLAQSLPQVKVVEGDILKILPKLVIGLKLETGNWKLLGNIPYYITGHLLRIIGELEIKPARTVLMIQKEVAQRLTAKPGAMNLLAAATQIWADISVITTLAPEDFDPPPKVKSAVVTLESRKQNLESSALNAYYRLIHAAFKQPRKTLLNNLSEGFKLAKADLLPILQELGFTETTRAQELGIDDLITLASTLREGK